MHAPRCERHCDGLRTVDDVDRDHLDARARWSTKWTIPA